MKQSKTVLLAVLSSAFLTVTAAAEVELGVRVDEDGIKGFHMAISEHFQISYNKVESVSRRSIPNDEIPVAFFIAELAEVPVWAIIDLRASGKSWIEISWHYGLTAEAFYVKFDRDPGPPYGKAWGHFNKQPHNKWKDIRLSDDDIVNFVNLRFISDHYGYDPYEVIKMRDHGDDFVHINGNVKNKAAEKRNKEAQAKADSPKKGKQHSNKGKPDKK